MTLLRRHITYLLIVVLTLTGHSMAIARGAAPSVGHMELCAGNTTVMVAVDANGQPTGESHICPEFSLMLSEGLTPEPGVVMPMVSRWIFVAVSEKDQSAPQTWAATKARGPPV